MNIWCGYSPTEDGRYFAAFRIVISNFVDQVWQSQQLFVSPDAATRFAESNAETFLRLLAVFGIIDPEEAESNYWEQISPN